MWWTLRTSRNLGARHPEHVVITFSMTSGRPKTFPYDYQSKNSRPKSWINIWMKIHGWFILNCLTSRGNRFEDFATFTVPIIFKQSCSSVPNMHVPQLICSSSSTHLNMRYIFDNHTLQRIKTCISFQILVGGSKHPKYLSNITLRCYLIKVNGQKVSPSACCCLAYSECLNKAVGIVNTCCGRVWVIGEIVFQKERLSCISQNSGLCSIWTCLCQCSIWSFQKSESQPYFSAERVVRDRSMLATYPWLACSLHTW